MEHLVYEYELSVDITQILNDSRQVGVDPGQVSRNFQALYTVVRWVSPERHTGPVQVLFRVASLY
jgi:hypothetical protein